MIVACQMTRMLQGLARGTLHCITAEQTGMAGREAAMLILDDDAVRGLLRMEELIPAMECALVDLSAGWVVHPVRSMMPASCDRRTHWPSGFHPKLHGAVEARR